LKELAPRKKLVISMKAWSNKTKVEAIARFALDELRRTDRTKFEVTELVSRRPVAGMSRPYSLQDKALMAAILAIKEIKEGSNARYRLERSRRSDEVVVFASHKMGPGDILRDSERRTFRKFGLELREGIKVDDDQIGRLAELGVKLEKSYLERDPDEDRVLFFFMKPSDARGLLRA
jgi:hypothetical protein